MSTAQKSYMKLLLIVLSMLRLNIPNNLRVTSDIHNQAHEKNRGK